MMNTYVISLKSSSLRREHISNEFAKQNINFDFFDAVTPSISKNIADTLGVNISDTELTQGEIACLLSHVSLWKKALDEELDYIAIFEDDIYLGKNSDYFLNNFEWIPEYIDIIKLEAFAKQVKIPYRALPLNLNGRKLYRLKGIHLGCAGYILSNNACKNLLDLVKTYSNIIAVDHIVFEDLICNLDNPIYQLNPAICIQSDILNSDTENVFESSLEKERRKRFNIKLDHKKKKLSLKDKFIREIMRLINQLIGYYEHRKIKFK